MKYVIFDIDGILANADHRLHYLQKSPKDWDSFFKSEEMAKDELILAGIGMLYSVLDRAHLSGELGAVFFTGRPEKTREATTEWFKTKVELHFHQRRTPVKILMRPDGDFRNDDILKEQWLLELGPQNVLCAFEDRTRIVEMYRRHGVTCYQGAPGNF